jgi:hypothetical protein
MITINNLRTRGNEPPFSPIVSEVSIQKALDNLLIYELGYGGSVTEFTPTSVTTVTHVMGCVDVTIFTGNEEEMKLLTTAASIATNRELSEAVCNKNEIDVAAAISEYILKVEKGMPLLVGLGSSILVGRINTRMIMIAMLQNPKYTERLICLNASTLFSILCLVLIDKEPIESVMELI